MHAAEEDPRAGGQLPELLMPEARSAGREDARRREPLLRGPHAAEQLLARRVNRSRHRVRDAHARSLPCGKGPRDLMRHFVHPQRVARDLGDRPQLEPRDAAQAGIVERRNAKAQSGERVRHRGHELAHRVRIGDGLEWRTGAQLVERGRGRESGGRHLPSMAA